VTYQDKKFYIVAALCLSLMAVIVILEISKSNYSSAPAPPAPKTKPAYPDEAPREDPPTDEEILSAIRMTEGYGGDRKVGAHGERGTYQIRYAFWQDGAEKLGVDWNYYTDVYDDNKCVCIIKAYWSRYGARTAREKFAMFCGGPDGHDQLMAGHERIGEYVRFASVLLPK